MALYFLRHGESEANVQGVFAGQREDSPLTIKGRQQAAITAAAIDIRINRIVSSPLARAHQTALIIANGLPGSCEVIVDDRIAEYDMGALTGSPLRKLSSQQLVTADGAEDPYTFQHRVQACLHEYVPTVMSLPPEDGSLLRSESLYGYPRKGANRAFKLHILRTVRIRVDSTLLVSHAGVGRMITSIKQSLPPAEFYNLPAYPNAALVPLSA